MSRRSNILRRRFTAAVCVAAAVVWLAVIPALVGGCERARPAQKATTQEMPYAVAWVYEAGAKVPAATVVYAGVVYLADEEGTLHALRLSDATTLWKFSAGAGFKAAPAIAGDRLYIGDGSGRMHAVAIQDGRELWSAEVGSPILAAAVPAGDHVVFNTDAGEIVALAADTGRRLWTVATGDSLRGGPAVGGGLVFAAGCDMKLHAMRLLDGAEQAAIDLHEQSGATPLALPGMVLVGSFRGVLHGIALPQLEPEWTLEPPTEVDTTYASPATAYDGRILFAPGNNVSLINAGSGKAVWSVEAPAEIAGLPAFDGARAIYASGGKLYVVDLATGAPLWQFDAGSAVSAVAAAENRIIVTDAIGKVYCLTVK